MDRNEQVALDKAFKIEDAMDTVFSTELLATVAAIIHGDRFSKQRFIDAIEKNKAETP